MSSPLLNLAHTVCTEDAGQRLDRLLATAFPELSRARFQALIADGRVTVEGQPAVDRGRRMKPGEAVAVSVPAAADPLPGPEGIALDVVYEDADLIVVDKPAGLVVHPAAGHETGTLVNALIGHCGVSLSGINGVRRPGIVHRLDMDTSGLIVAAKTDAAHRGLAGQFASHGRDGALEREYRALVWGRPEPPRGHIETGLARSRENRQKIAVSSRAEARRAITHYALERGFAHASLLRLALETGRTHQIRVHTLHLGHPILGDRLYGRGFRASEGKLPEAARAALARLGRQALHAAVLGFLHPVSGRRLRFESALPEDFQALVDSL